MATKNVNEKYQDATREILSQLDLRSTYQQLGLSIPERSKPRRNGWLPCHAMGREDKNPSAEINIAGESPAAGRYRDFGGGGESMSLFDFAARYGNHKGDWREARRFFAREAGVKLPNGEDEQTADKFEMSSLTPGVALLWAKGKQGVSARALMQVGGTAATWPKKASPSLAQHLIAFPMFGEGGLDLDAEAWHCVNANPRLKIRKFKGKGVEPDHLKTMSVGGIGLMNVWALRNMPKAEVVWVVEGITDLLAMQTALGERTDHVVVSAGGCTAHPRAEWLPLLAGKDVRICFDADEPGEAGAKRWVTEMMKVSESVRWVKLPFEVQSSHGKDLRDFLADNAGAYDALWRLSEEAKPVEPEQEEAKYEPHKAVLERLGIVVVGRVGDWDWIEIFSVKRQETTVIKDIEGFTYAKALMALGDVVKEHVSESREPIPGMITMRDVRNAIGLEAGQTPKLSESALGRGIWAVDDKLVLVGPNFSHIWDGEKLELSSTPFLGDQRFHYGGEPWYDADELQGYLRLSSDPEWCKKVMCEATDLFMRWDNWDNLSSPELVAGLFAASWIQTVWETRPLVSVRGPSNCGKTMLTEDCLAKMFGKLSVPIAKGTEAGIRVMIGETASVMFIDEFEHDKNRAKILELLRTSTKGTTIPRSNSFQKLSTFGLRHIVWVGGIELNLDRTADGNRFISLELGSVAQTAGRARLRLPPEGELKTLGVKVLAVAIRYWQDARDLAVKLAEVAIEGCDSRLTEIYAVPAAMLAVSLGWDEQTTSAFLSAAMRDSGEAEVETDEERLLDAILGAERQLPRGNRMSIAKIMTDQVIDLGAGDTMSKEDILDEVGIVIDRYGTEEDEAEPSIFFGSREITNKLLKGSEYEGFSIRQVLRRVEGAVDTRKRIGGRYMRGVKIPISSLKNLIGFSLDNSVEGF